MERAKNLITVGENNEPKRERIWVISPYHNRSPFDKVWEFDKKNNLIAIGWAELGDLSGLSNDEIYHRYIKEAKKGNKDYKVHSQAPTFLYDFYNKINIDDIVIARQGWQKIIGIGRVTRQAYFDKKKGEEPFKITKSKAKIYPHIIDVNWKEISIDLRNMFHVENTVSEISIDKFNDLGIKKPASIYKSVERQDHDPSLEGIEGAMRQKISNHFIHERDRKFVKTYKDKFRNIKSCPKCGIQPESLYGLDEYGIKAIDFFELHHKEPISQKKEKSKVIEEDVELLCPNCHTMVHKLMSKGLNTSQIEEYLYDKLAIPF
jgi:hypothetical protein